ncbi:MAG: response regulator [Oligoflexia bacterium]|nr:response regulator [Oligoflexia bacterium]
MGVKNKSVLIIDDDPDIILLVSKILQNVGMDVKDASTVIQGLDLFQKSPPNLVLLDISLPDQNGFSFLKKQRTLTSLSSIPVIMLSASSDMSNVKTALALGAANYIVKPFKSTTLIQKIRKALLENGGDQNIFYLPSPVEATITINASVNSANSNELIIESPVCQNINCIAEIDGPIIDYLQLKNNIVKSVNKSELKNISGRYVYRASLMGLSESEQNMITKKIVKWKIKN